MIGVILNNYRNFRNLLYSRKVKDILKEQAIVTEPVSLSNTFSLENLTGKRENIHIGEGCVLQCQITVFEKGHFAIGNYNYVGNSQFICSGSIDIGSGCFFSDRILIFDGSHHPISARQRFMDAYEYGMKGVRPSAYSETCTHSPVKIGNAVWIGANSVITSGVSIGEGSIVGAGSVVTKDIPEWSIAVGNPAKVVKKLAPEDIEGALRDLS